MFVTCSDPVGITQAVQRAIDAGIPVFTADCNIAGIKQITSIVSNNYGMGMYTMRYIAEKIGGKGKVGMIGLPNNETWDLRELGARYVLTNYPGIETVYWPYDSTGAVTPRQAIENMMTANPDLVAIWSAWDGAAMEGALAAEQAGKNDIIFTGIDGGQRAFEQIQTDGPFKLSMAQSIYWMSYKSASMPRIIWKAIRFLALWSLLYMRLTRNCSMQSLRPWDELLRLRYPRHGSRFGLDSSSLIILQLTRRVLFLVARENHHLRSSSSTENNTLLTSLN